MLNLSLHCHGALKSAAVLPLRAQRTTQKVRRHSAHVPGDSRLSRATRASSNLNYATLKAHIADSRDRGANAAARHAPTQLEETATALPSDNQSSSKLGEDMLFGDDSEDDNFNHVDPEGRPLSLDDFYGINPDVSDEVRKVVLAPGYGPKVHDSPTALFGGCGVGTSVINRGSLAILKVLYSLYL
jgi:hypothetical protein